MNEYLENLTVKKTEERTDLVIELIKNDKSFLKELQKEINGYISYQHIYIGFFHTVLRVSKKFGYTEKDAILMYGRICRYFPNDKATLNEDLKGFEFFIDFECGGYGNG